jgi:hypothetical protein
MHHKIKLDLTGCDELSDKSLQYISQMKYLTELKLLYCAGLTDNGMKFLPKTLIYLDISCCIQITDKGFAYILLLKNLIHLNICYTKIKLNKDHIMTFKFLKNLNIFI